VPRSALIFSSSGDLGVRTVDRQGKVGFTPTTIVEDDQSFMWLAGVSDGARVIVQGQDFVREGNRVDAVAATELAASR
jgi:multidrug efflux system membrane fusion protein